MENQNLFFKSILIYLIFEKVFWIASALNETLLFKNNTSDNIYFAGFIISGVLSIISIILLYKYFIRQQGIKKPMVKISALFVVILLIFFSMNKYVGGLAENIENQETFDKYLSYSGYNNIIFFITSSIIFVLFFLTRNKKSES